MRHCRSGAVLAAALLAYGAAAQTTNNTNANSNSASGSSSNSTSQGNVGNVTTNNLAPTSNANSNSNSSSSTSSNSTANNAGNSQTIVFNTNTPAATTASSNVRSENHISGEQTLHHTYSGEQTIRYEHGDQTIKNTPSVSGAPLTTSNDTCMGSASAAVNVPGFGLGLGSTWTDRNCVMLKNARELWNMGMKAAALALFCTDANNRMALEITGFVCPQTQRAQQLAASQVEAARVASAKLDAERRQQFAAQNPRVSATVPPALPLELMPPLPAVVAQPDPEPRPLASAPPVAAAPAVGSAQPPTTPAAETPQPVAAMQPAAVVRQPPPAPAPDAAPQNPVIVRVVSVPAR
jgi:hypothetical protein